MREMLKHHIAAVLTVTDDNGKVTWEADIPADVYAQAKGGAA